MSRILVAGGLCTEGSNPKMEAARETFAGAVGREVVSRGHVLLGGCRTSMDKRVADAAAEAAQAHKIEPRKCIKSWVTKTTEPIHSVGEIIRSRMGDWRSVPKGLVFPEPVQEADVVIIIGGWDGTHYAATWARMANKPIIPVAAFGMAAAEIFEDELASFDKRYSNKITVDEYQSLNRLLPDWETKTVESFAEEVTLLAERLVRPTEAFVIMSFAETGELSDAYDTLVRVCTKFGYRAFKVDDHLDSTRRIVPAITSAIRRSAFVIADVTDPRPNVYYELGYAHALAKDVVLTAKKGTALPFDIFDVPTQYWDSQGALAKKLEAEFIRMGMSPTRGA